MTRRFTPVIAALAMVLAAWGPAPATASLPDVPGLNDALMEAGVHPDQMRAEQPAPDPTASVAPAAPVTPALPAMPDVPVVGVQELMPTVEIPEIAASQIQIDDPVEAEPASASDEYAVVERSLFVGDGMPRSAGNVTGCPSAVTCDAHSISPQRWASGSIAYWYNDAGRPARAPSMGTVLGALHASAAQWSRWNPSVSLSYQGSTSAPFGRMGSDGSCADGVNTVTWRPMAPGTLGTARICYNVRTLQVRDADLALNSTLAWAQFGGPNPSSSAYDLQSVLTHEFGHWLSLVDLHMPWQSAQTMYGSVQRGETRKRTLALGDIVGMQRTYPCSGCPRSGIIDD